jgi:hypothetical protein
MTSSIETEILRRLAQDELYENASIESFGTHASRIRAAAAAAQPVAFAILNSVRGRGGGATPSLFQGAPQAAPPGGPSLFDVALMQQRMALDEQSRMRAMAQAAATMRQQHQLSQLSQLSHLHQQEQHRHLQEQHQRSLKREREVFLKVNKALERLSKKRKVIDSPPLKVTAKKKVAGSSSFYLPKVDGKDVIPSIRSMDGFRANWDTLVAKAKSVGGDDEDRHAYVRHRFGLSLAQNRASSADTAPSSNAAFVRHHFGLSLEKNRAPKADTAASGEGITCVATV